MLEKVRCPSCRAEVAWAGNPSRPFCSDRCRTRDLGAWLTERYRIPEEDSPESAATDAASGHDGNGGGSDDEI